MRRRCAHAQGVKVWRLQRPASATTNETVGAGIGDMPERVSPFIAKFNRVGGAANADAVHDKQECARHQGSILPSTGSGGEGAV